MEKEEIAEKISKGWVKSRLWFEVMAVDKATTEDSLKKHIEKVRGSRDTIILSENYEVAQEVAQLPAQLKQAFTQAVKVEVLTKNVEVLLYVVIFFAPSAVEILEPGKLTVGMETIQAIMNSVSDVIHRFAAQGAGGMVISTK